MKSYLNILENILVNGKWKNNRTGIDTKSITGSMFEHDMSTGFPLLTSKFVSLKTVAVELEGFIKGITSKKWFQDRKCHIWDDWCNPQVVPYGNDEATKAKMKAEDDLGLIYGSQWRDFRDPDMHTKGDGIDQLKTIVNNARNSNQTKVSSELTVNEQEKLWKIDNLDSSYISKTFLVTANTSMSKYTVNVKNLRFPLNNFIKFYYPT
jgi:thymidylate synthase